jgi:hypothetical protein
MGNHDPSGAPSPTVPTSSRGAVGLRGDLPVGAVIVVALAALGAPLGWLWQQISPHTLAFVSASYLVPDETESQVAADGRALIISVVVGVAVGVGAWLWRARRGPVMVAAAVLGSAACMGVLAIVGKAVSGGTEHGAVNSVITLPIAVHARAVLVAAPLLALLIYLAGALFAARDDLGRPDRAAPAFVADPAQPSPAG